MAKGKLKKDLSEMDVTKEEVKQDLAETEMRATMSPPKHQSGVNSRSSVVPDNAKIYVGKYKNAEVPTGKPFAVESYEEYLARDAPPGFGPKYGQHSSITPEAISPRELPSFYHKEELGSATLFGYTLTTAVGAGVRIKSSGVGLTAQISLDLYLNNFSVTLAGFSVGYGVSGKQACIRDLGIKRSFLRLEADACLTLSFTGSRLSIGGSVTLCADGCPGSISCGICESLGFSPVSFNVPV